MERETRGIFRLKGKDLAETMRELGRAHATDRASQMAMMRIIGTGRTTECLADEPDLLEVDRFFRWIGLYRGADEEVEKLGEREKKIIEAYCEGVNETMASRRRPMPFRAWGYTWEPWRPQDVVTLVRLMAWVGLVSAQVNVEKAIIEMVRGGVGMKKLAELFGPHIDGCDADLLKSVELTARLTPPGAEVKNGVGSLSASNNWVVAPSKSETGAALLANDPHLEVNRLPPVWYEAVLEVGDDYLMGITVPGLPGVVTGRNGSLAWGMTYTEGDMTDFFVEDCRDGKYLRDGEWKAFEKIEETIRRKKGGNETVTVYRNGHGLLLGDAEKAGKYLCLAWTAWHGKVADILETVYTMNLGRTVKEGMAAVGKFHYPSLNWVFADRQGNIGFKMAGLFPRRRDGWTGLYPVPGWKSENDWKGWVSPEDLPGIYNPPEGFFATANQDLQEYGKASIQNCPMNRHRDRRIRELLAEKAKLGVEDLQAIQLDILSLKAMDLVPLFLKHMPAGPAAKLLEEWDFRYAPQSRGAWLFERLYERALTAIFCAGEDGIPEDMFLHLKGESSVTLNMDGLLEAVLRKEKSAWFEGRSREEILREAFEGIDEEETAPWGAVNRITMTNIFFGGKLPKFLGMDRGPFAVPGSTDTPRQGTVYRDAGRDTSFCPSYRFVTDMGSDAAWTIIPGGPSEKRFSDFYIADLEDWLEGRYKKIEGKKARG
jgi:penicillin amidase